MTTACDIGGTTPTRTDLRLIVLAQWIRAGLALTRAAAAGRGLVGGAVALWRLAQAVRLAILLARRLAQAQGAPRASVLRPASTPVPAWSLDAAPLDDDALRRAMAELEAVLADALAVSPHGRVNDGRLSYGRPSDWDRARPARIFVRAGRETPGPVQKPHGRRTPPRGRRPLRPPGPDRPCRRRWRTPGALDTAPTPIAPLAVGRDPLA